MNQVVLSSRPEAGDDVDEKLDLISLASGDIAQTLSTQGGRWARGRRTALLRSSLPPKIDTTPVVDHVFRFASTASTLKTITVIDMFGALGCMGTVTNSKVQPFCGSFRLNSVTIYPSTSTTTQTDVDLLWAGDANAHVRDSEVERSIPAGVSVTSPLRFVPPRNMEVSMWHAATSAGNLFTLIPGTASIIDVHVTYTMVNAFTAANVTVTTAVIGTVYYLALDGPGGTLVPRGLTSTN